MPPPPEPLGLGPIILVTKDDKSRVTGDCYARFCGSPGVRLPRATRPEKSLEGTLAMLVLSWVSVFAVLSWNYTFSSEQALLVSALTATVTTAAELATSNGLDTFFCPAAAMLILCPAHLLFQ